MQRLSIGIVAAALVAGIVLLGTSDGARAFVVDGHEVSQDTIDDELEVLAEHPDFASGLVDPSVGTTFGAGSVGSNLAASWVTVRIITEHALAEVERRDERITAEDRRSTLLEGAAGFDEVPADFRRQITEGFAAVRALQRLAAPDATARAQAQCQSGRFVSHILVATEADAAAVASALAAGEDFAAVARERSTDPGTSALGGYLGCFDQLGDLVEPFLDATEALPLDTVSEPVESEFGFHLILVTSTPAQSDIDAAGLAVVLERVGRATVDLDPRYGQWVAQLTQVMPPEPPAGG